MNSQKYPSVWIEGGDSTFKATNALMLAGVLRKAYRVAYISYPVYEFPWGKVVADYLGKRGREQILLSPEETAWIYALNRLETLPHLEKLLSRGYITILNRSPFSNYYNFARELIAQNVSWESLLENDKKMFFEKPILFDRAFFEVFERHSVPILPIILHAGHEQARSSAVIRAKRVGEPLDRHETDLQLQELTTAIYRDFGVSNIDNIHPELIDVVPGSLNDLSTYGEDDTRRFDAVLKNAMAMWKVVSRRFWGRQHNLGGEASPSKFMYWGKEILRTHKYEESVTYEFRRLGVCQGIEPSLLNITHPLLMRMIEEKYPRIIEAWWRTREITREIEGSKSAQKER